MIYINKIRGLRKCAILAGAFMTITLPAFSQSASNLPKVGPDLLQSLGVGSRSIAMGNAFSAIGDDASATFWNPGRLFGITKRQFMIEYRSAVGGRFTQYSVGQTFGGIRPEDPQPAFVGMVAPIERLDTVYDVKDDPDHPGQKIRTPSIDPLTGAYKKNAKTLLFLGVSYTLGGYYDHELRTPAAVAGTTYDLLSDTNIRNTFVTISAGNHTTIKGRELGYGVGVVFLNQGQRRFNGEDDPTIKKLNQNETGTGTGYILGLSYRPKGLYRLALTYRSLINIGGLSDAGTLFGDQIPSRMSLGVAYESKWGPDEVTVSSELQYFGSANNKTVDYGGGLYGPQQDRRESVTNFHIGFEWLPKKKPLVPWFGTGKVRTPIRFGFHTNANAATSYTYYDNVVSMGFAVENNWLSVEPAAEVFTSNGMMLWTLTGTVKF